jgi:penicillin-binding protein 1A
MKFSPLRFLARTLVVLSTVVVVVVLVAAAGGAYLVSEAYESLPELSAMTDYKPKIPLRIYTSDKILIGEFGDERRSFTSIKEIPSVMRLAVLAAEDDRFYEHKGVDLQGVLRAAINNARGGPKQGASTITQQVARNFFLTREQTLKRKFYEALLAYKIEQTMGKDQILEIYMNQIFLGQRAYGFAAASQIYFAKSMPQISIAQAAMLAGLPKAPSAYNPVSNPKRARERQVHILSRMRALNYISEQQYNKAMAEPIDLALGVRPEGERPSSLRADYAVEMARQFAVERFKDEAYTKGISIYTTLVSSEQDVAYHALRKGVMNYDHAHGYRGPEGYVDVGPPGSGVGKKEEREAFAKALKKAFAEHPESDGIYAAVVLESSSKSVRARIPSGAEINVTAEGIVFAASALALPQGAPKSIRRGSILRVEREAGVWRLTQIPEVASAFVAASPRDGSIRALVGGFDFGLNKFNRVAQAYRQPGSSFKPFIYSSSLEKGLSPSTMINDAPFVYDPGHGAAIWSPKNYDGKTEGLMTMRRGLTLSKNLVSVRIMNFVGPQYAQNYATRFGFESSKNPPVLALALGSGGVTPLQMAGAYSVFANGGYKVDPYLVALALDTAGNVLYKAQPKQAGEEDNRVIDEPNAFIMDTMLRDVAQKGTAAKASATLKRTDLAGKTGTTNDSVDAWFAGYHPDIVGVAWIGFDQPRSLGSRETGGGVALPIWIDFMAKALEGKPVGKPRPMPEGVILSGGDYYMAEYPPGTAIRSLGANERPKGDEDAKDGEEQKRDSENSGNILQLIDPAEGSKSSPARGNIVHFGEQRDASPKFKD